MTYQETIPRVASRANEQAPISGDEAPDRIGVAAIRCAHCYREVSGTLSNTSGPVFCCGGCESVYRTLHDLGMEDFYHFRDLDGGGWVQRVRPVALDDEPQSWFEDSEYAARFVQRLPDGRSLVTLSLDGIHCAGCVWLIERLPELLAGVSSARVDLSSGAALIVFSESACPFSALVRFIRRLGYEPRPLDDRSRAASEQQADRVLLRRLGIAAFSAANTMLLAVSIFQGLFTGMEDRFASLFRWVSLILAMPAVTYAAWPFYAAAAGGLRIGRLHLDLPIALAILAAFGVSSWNTLAGNPNVYFDSLSALIFLMLLGRYLQNRALRKARTASRIAWNVLPVSVTVLRDGTPLHIPARELQAGARMVFEPGARLPVDGVVVEGTSTVDLSFLTGESLPVPVFCGVEVACGALNLESRLEIEVSRPYSETEFGKLVAEITTASDGRPEILRFTDRVGKVFVITVLVLAVMTGAVWSYAGMWARGVEYAFTMLIVTCPCALAIVAPVTLSVAVARAAREGILFLGADVLERMTKVDRIYLDKTGTVTSGVLSVSDMLIDPEVAEEKLRELVRPLAKHSSRHPSARAIIGWAGDGKSSALTRLSQVLGCGVEGELPSGEIVRLGSIAWALDGLTPNDRFIQLLLRNSGTPLVAASCGGRVLAVWVLRDSLRPAAPASCAILRALGHRLSLLSGDRREVAARVGVDLGIGDEEIFAGCSPAEKAEILSRNGGRNAMVGDGINDGLALKNAAVGIAVRGAVRVNAQVADVLIPDEDIATVALAFRGAHRTMRFVRRALWASFLYNVIAAGVTAAGLMNPFFAAFVMPLSALSALIASLSINPFTRPPLLCPVPSADLCKATAQREN